MNIKEYISGGMIESYVLGLATDQERTEFEKLCLQYPALLAARKEFEEKLEKRAFEQAIDPPAFLKEKILADIREEESSVTETKVIAMDTRPRSSSWIRYVAAASVILLIASAYFAYDFYSKNKQLQQTANLLQSKYDSLNAHMEEQEKMMAVVTKPGLKVVNMVGDQGSRSSADIYWDSTSTDVYMIVKNLPQLPTEKQFQLWAFIDGQPVDLGLFDVNQQNHFLKMKNTRKAEAFAITIENRGNGPVPGGKVETMGKTNL